MSSMHALAVSLGSDKSREVMWWNVSHSFPLARVTLTVAFPSGVVSFLKFHSNLLERLSSDIHDLPSAQLALLSARPATRWYVCGSVFASVIVLASSLCRIQHLITMSAKKPSVLSPDYKRRLSNPAPFIYSGPPPPRPLFGEARDARDCLTSPSKSVSCRYVVKTYLQYFMLLDTPFRRKEQCIGRRPRW